MQPSVLTEASFAASARNLNRFLPAGQIISYQFEHLIPALITNDFLSHDEVASQVWIECCQIQPSSGSRNLKIPGFDVRQTLRYPIPPMPRLIRLRFITATWSSPQTSVVPHPEPNGWILIPCFCK